AIALARGSDPAREALVAAFVAAYRSGSQVATIFWGLWLLPFGLLILRSGFLPKVLGVLMALGCFAYLAHSAAALFFPSYSLRTQQTLWLPTAGEIGAIFWLLAKGVRAPAATAAA